MRIYTAMIALAVLITLSGCAGRVNVHTSWEVPELHRGPEYSALEVGLNYEVEL